MNKEILNKIFSVFKAFEIPYALIGGYAVAVWGTVRATRDIDFLAAIPFANIKAVVEKFKETGFSVEYRKGDIGDPVSGVIKLNTQTENEEVSVELILGIKRMPERIFLRAEYIKMTGIEIPVVSPEDLIVLKLLAGGPLDLQDARSIRQVMAEKLDNSYLDAELKRCKLVFN